jgi:hypothetical protein
MTVRRSFGPVQGIRKGTGVEHVATIGDLPLRGYLAGLGMANDTDTDADIAISAGVCRDAGDTNFIRQTTNPLTKQIDAVWAAGDDAGGFPDGLSGGTVDASTWYHVFVLGHVNGTADAGFDSDISATNLLADTAVAAAGYTLYRRIGSVLTDGTADIITFVQYGDRFAWSAPVLDVSEVGAHDTSAGLATTLTVPPDVRVEAEIALSVDAAASPLWVFPMDITNADCSATAAPLALVPITHQDAPHRISGMLTNTSRQVRVRCADNAIQLYLCTYGWVDSRGRHD